MAKLSAIGGKFFVAQYDLTGDIGAIDGANATREPLDFTSLFDEATSRQLGRADGELSWNGYLNRDTGQHHAAMSAMGTADVIASWFVSSTVGAPAASLNAKQTSYDGTAGQDGAVAFSVGLLADGSPLEWGVALTAGKETDSAAGSATATVDTTASAAFGATAYLHVFSIASGTATVAVQDSADNVTFANVTGLAFTAASAATSERLATAATATVRQYLRVNTTGTFTNLVFAVMAHKFATSQT